MGNQKSKGRIKYTNCLLVKKNRNSYIDPCSDKTWFLNLSKKLLSYLDKGKNEKFKKTLLRFSCDVRNDLVTFDVNGVSCVNLACIRDNTEVMKFLLTDCQIDPNFENVKTGESILQLSCRRGNTNVAQCLIQHGADLSRRDNNGQTCIEVCCKDEKICRFLIDQGVRVGEWKDTTGRPIIFRACGTGNVDLFDFLLQHDIDINVTNVEELTPLEIASRNILQSPNYRYIVEKLMKNCQINPDHRSKSVEIIFCKIVESYLRQLTHPDIDFVSEFWFVVKQSQLEHFLLDSSIFDPYLSGNDGICPKGNDIRTGVLSDIDLVLSVSVQMMCNVYGKNNVETMSFVKLIAEFLCRQKKSDQFLNIFQSVFTSSLKHVGTVSELWINELIMILIYLIRFCKTPDENLCNFVSEVIVWAIKKLKLSLAETMEKFISLDAVIRMFSLLKYLCLWQFPSIEQRDVCLRKIMTELGRDIFSYESQSFLHYGVHDFMCFRHHSGRRQSCEEVITLLLEHGLPADTTDKAGNTALVLLLQRLPEIDTFSEDLVRSMIDYSHLCIKNMQGDSAFTLLKRHRRYVCVVKHRTLQCLCAETIQRLHIPYTDFVPRPVACFIKIH